jgi:hypothetical protein
VLQFEECSFRKLSKNGHTQRTTTSIFREQWEQMKQDLQTMQATISMLRSEIDSIKSNDSDLEGIHAPGAILRTM